MRTLKAYWAMAFLCLLMAATISVEIAPARMAQWFCPEMAALAARSFESMETLETDRFLSEGPEFLQRANAPTLEAAVFRFITADVSPQSSGDLLKLATWTSWLSRNANPVSVFKAMSLALIYLLLNPISLIYHIRENRRWTSSDKGSLQQGSIETALPFVTLLLLGIALPALISQLLSIVHPFEPSEGKVIWNLVYLLVWIGAWVVAWIFGLLQMICEWTLFPLVLIVCSPVLVLHAALFG